MITAVTHDSERYKRYFSISSATSPPHLHLPANRNTIFRDNWLGINGEGKDGPTVTGRCPRVPTSSGLLFMLAKLKKMDDWQERIIAAVLFVTVGRSLPRLGSYGHNRIHQEAISRLV